LAVNCAYILETNYQGNSFFNGWQFFTGNDPTHGTVDYVSQSVAQQKGYIGMRGEAVYIGCDTSTVVSTKVRGRQSVRISTTKTWNQGLFIMDLAHMPTGCATWPAWWLVGPNWPNFGEIDIIEGVNTGTVDHTTLHTSNGCDMSHEDPHLFSGSWAKDGNTVADNCYIKAPGQSANQGCSIIGSPNSFGAPFNEGGGGVYVAEWNSTLIRMFYFSRGRIPADITAKTPNPDGWGTPYAFFELGQYCNPDHFQDESMVINLTFCGDWAGSAFSSNCPGDGDCATFVRNNPHAFQEAYWQINYVSVYQQG
jgi:hypothetical protein